jgi:hypothetical protein
MIEVAIIWALGVFTVIVLPLLLIYMWGKLYKKTYE